jgi:hypothetical protein
VPKGQEAAIAAAVRRVMEGKGSGDSVLHMLQLSSGPMTRCS